MNMTWQSRDLRLVQYNLQIKDTGRMVPEEIAESVRRMNANAVVLNAGGIYAWYESKVPFHHINEYLPQEGSLLERIIECCHQRNISVIGRFDFSKADDVVYLNHPEWFVQDTAGQPVIYGSGRMGEWSLLMSTCINGGYRNREFALPVLQEALAKLEIDGIFFNAPHMERCFCENCRRKYKKIYGEELPEDHRSWRRDWSSLCLKDNMELLYEQIKALRPDMPVILYYGTYRQGEGTFAENLDMRYATADFVCTEAQDILSAGKRFLPDVWKPTLNMKLGQCVPDRPAPFGIIHSCPGMDWRHSGLPSAEYEFWMSQIPAAGGWLWHSLTGFDAVITDRRLLRVAAQVNKKAQKAAEYMQDSKSAAEVLLLWNAGLSEQGFTEGLMKGRIPFDLMDVWHLDPDRMCSYPMVIVPDRFPLDTAAIRMLEDYVKRGGRIFWEKTDTEQLEEIAELLGIREEAVRGRELTAAYGVMEEAGAAYKKQLEETVYIPVRGDVLYVRKQESTETLMTLVPPFAPPDGVGAPPERASMPVLHTQIPLLLKKRIGNGCIISCFFGLSELLRTVGLEDHKQLFENCVRQLLGGEQRFDGSPLEEGIFVYPWMGKKRMYIHLVNGIGERPLRTAHVCRDISFCVHVREIVRHVYSALDERNVFWEQKEETLTVRIDCLAVWDMIIIEW